MKHERLGRRLARWVTLACLLVLAACEDATSGARGPQGAPVSSVSASRFDLGTQSFKSLSANELVSALQDLTGADLPGVQVKLLANTQVVSVIVSLDRFRPVLLDPSLINEGELTAATLLDGSSMQMPGTDAGGESWPAQDSLLIGSFFVAGFAPLTPLGLLQVNGRALSPLQPHGYTRILGIQQGRLGVVHRGAFHRGQFGSAVQVGPGIVEAGRLDINSTEVQLPKYLRSFVGICGDRALLGVTLEPMHLYALGQLIEQQVTQTTQPALLCDEVVNLSGDRETLLVLPESGGQSLLVYGDPRAPKSALLGFRAKRDRK